MQGTAGSILGPSVVAISLGLVGHHALAERLLTPANRFKSPSFTLQELVMLNTLLAHYGSPTTIICNLRGPWAPRMRVCSISAERDGPVIMLTVRGMTPAPKRPRRSAI